MLVVGDSETPRQSLERSLMPAWGLYSWHHKETPELGQALDCHPHLLFHEGTIETMTRSLRNINRDFISLGKLLKGSSSVLLNSPSQRLWPEVAYDQVSGCLHSWYHDQGFRFYDLGHAFDRSGLLIGDGAHLTKWGKSILGSKLAGLIIRALN